MDQVNNRMSGRSRKRGAEDEEFFSQRDLSTKLRHQPQVPGGSVAKLSNQVFWLVVRP